MVPLADIIQQVIDHDRVGIHTKHQILQKIACL